VVLQVHHRRYQRYAEHPDDLITLCRACHVEAHRVVSAPGPLDRRVSPAAKDREATEDWWFEQMKEWLD